MVAHAGMIAAEQSLGELPVAFYCFHTVIGVGVSNASGELILGMILPNSIPKINNAFEKVMIHFNSAMRCGLLATASTTNSYKNDLGGLIMYLFNLQMRRCS